MRAVGKLLLIKTSILLGASGAPILQNLYQDPLQNRNRMVFVSISTPYMHINYLIVGDETTVSCAIQNITAGHKKKIKYTKPSRQH